jgi:hypothetical protein
MGIGLIMSPSFYNLGEMNSDRVVFYSHFHPTPRHLVELELLSPIHHTAFPQYKSHPKSTYPKKNYIFLVHESIE